MKILWSIVSIPLAIIISIILYFISRYFLGLINSLVPEVYQYSSWFPNFLCGISFVVCASIFNYEKKNTFIIISLIIILLTFVGNIIYFNKYEFAFLIGGVLSAFNLFLNAGNDLDIKKQYGSEEKNNNEEDFDDEISNDYYKKSKRSYLIRKRSANSFNNKKTDVESSTEDDVFSLEEIEAFENKLKQLEAKSLENYQK